MSESVIKTYKVGGCIRDRLLNVQSHDTDYVVVGATVQYMLDHGFVQVGRNFPVFIHPKTHEEYALARTEQKIGNGYHGFQCDSSPNVTLVEDLSRRDITINAIAEDESGNLIDPYNGINDLHNHLIRHVSKAFSEDPLRVIRVARFKAQLGFTIVPETIILMKQIVNSGELKYLSHERIFGEIKKVLKTPGRFDQSTCLIIFLQTLYQVCALDQINSALSQLASHDKFMLRLEQAILQLENSCDNLSNLTYDESAKIKYAILIGIAALDSGVEYALAINKLSGHEKSYNELGLLVGKNIQNLVNLAYSKPVDILTLIHRLDLIRRPKRVQQLYLLMSSILDSGAKNLEFIKQVTIEFKQIDHIGLQQNISHHLFIQKLTETQLSIINKLYKQYFGIHKC